MATEKQVRIFKRKFSAVLLQTPGVCGVGVEQDESGDYILAVHLSEDTVEVRQTVQKTVGAAPVKMIPSGPFKKLRG